MNQDYTIKPVRAAAILTANYVAGTVIKRAELQNQLLVYVYFTKGSLTTLEVKIEFSDDGVTYVQETFSAISGATSTETAGVHQFGATGNYRIPVEIKDQFIKISVKGTGTVDDSSCAVKAVVGVA